MKRLLCGGDFVGGLGGRVIDSWVFMVRCDFGVKWIVRCGCWVLGFGGS